MEWATLTVNIDKGNGVVRICGDFRATINSNLIADQHFMPSFEEMTTKIARGESYSVIDLKDAYLQMEVVESSRKYLIIATHMGYFRYKRLPFGIASAPAIFQRYMDGLLREIPNVGLYLDDIIKTGKTRTEHLQNLREVMRRLYTAGIRTRVTKCHFLKPSVTYLGHKIDKEGIHPTEEKVEAIRETPSPKNVRKLRAFLGTINYHERFIPHLQGRCANLHRLTGRKLSIKKKKTFRQLKRILSSSDTIILYDEKFPIILTRDASKYGLGTTIFHQLPDGSERPIAYASRILSETEKRYAPIDREALALVFGVNKFHQYLYGREFKLITDHKPLERIFGNRRDLPKMSNNRLTRWALLLSTYKYTISYRTGKKIRVLTPSQDYCYRRGRYHQKKQAKLK